jgi:Cu2+-exporting ATPase
MLPHAAMLARASRHPLSRAVANAAGPGIAAANVQEVAGQGLEGDVAGRKARLGRALFVGAPAGDDDSTSVIWYAEEGHAPVAFHFTDGLRQDAAACVSELGQLGLAVEMLSGDREAPAAEAARQAGITVWHAANTPTQKSDHLDALKRAGHRVLMIGDGLNDAAALSVAHVSISPGTAVQASQTAADMILQGEQLQPIVEAIRVARRAHSLVLQNFAFSAAYNVLAVPLAALGMVTPLIAALAMSGSSIIVMLNALRLAKFDRVD